MEPLYSLIVSLDIDMKVPKSGQCDSALGNRVWKSSCPTHFGVILTRTMDETVLLNCATQA